MADKCQVESACTTMGWQDSVCIHTKKICDSCIDKDCIEDLRVYLPQESQMILDQATNAKAPSCCMSPSTWSPPSSTRVISP